MSRRLIVLLVVGLLGCAPALAGNAWGAVSAPAPEAESAAPSVSSMVSLSPYEAEVIRLTNAERVKAGLWPLAASPSLMEAARAHASDMAGNGFLSHTGSDGSLPDQRACQAGYAPYPWGSCYVGENCAAGYQTPAAVVAAWMNSSGHRANILKPEYREIGVGFAQGGPAGYYWAQSFGSQPRVLPVHVNDGAGTVSASSVKLELTDETVSSWGSIGPATQMMVSNTSDFAGSSWQPYARIISWNLTGGAGGRTVYARLRDASGDTVTSSVSVTVENPVQFTHRTFIPAVTRP